MSDSMAMNVALIVGLIVFVYNFVFVFLKGTSKKQKFIEKAKKQGNYTTGRQCKVKVYKGDITSNDENIRSDTFEVTYEYTVGGKIYKKKLCFNNPGVVGSNHPYEVTLYYDEKNPGKAVCPQEASRLAQRQSGCFTTLVVTVITIELIYQVLKRLF